MSATKPPYLSAMAALAAIGRPLRVASLFSGCGGSSLGYKLAGLRVVYGNEFVAAAADVYAANFPTTYLDRRDIRTIAPAEILAAVGLEPGELDVLDGSPPCASFSMAGKRSSHWGQVKVYSETRQRTDDLFYEYARILAGIRPRVFVAENVAGLVRGVAKGYFKRIFAALGEAGYVVRAKLLDAAWLGVPQYRARLIFVGVRSDLVARYSVGPAFPKPFGGSTPSATRCLRSSVSRRGTARTPRTSAPRSTATRSPANGIGSVPARRARATSTSPARASRRRRRPLPRSAARTPASPALPIRSNAESSRSPSSVDLGSRPLRLLGTSGSKGAPRRAVPSR